MTSDRLPKYEKYRPARLSWLGEIPAHWEEKRAKFFFREVDERSATGEEELLSVSHVTGVTPRSQKNVTMFKAESYAGHKLCRTGDLVINTMWAWMAALGVASQSGIVSSSYAVYRPIKTETFVPEYMDSLLRTKLYSTEYFCRSTGIRPSRLRLYPEKFLDIPVACPPRYEQESMVNYLREKDQQIHRFIRNKRRRIELLNEEKQVIINRAVTCGLDSSLRLKPAGIDCLDDMPEHWELLPFTKYVSDKADYRGATPEKTESGVFLVTAKNVRMGFIDYESSKEYIAEDSYMDVMRRGLPKIGDILFTTEAPLGNAAIVDREDIALAQRIIRFRMNPRWFDSHFTLLSMMANYFQTQLQIRATGSTAQGIKASKLPELRILHPSLEEQNQIVEYVEYESKKIAQTIQTTEREIKLIREYRTRLITDVVTGKVDVRHLVPQAGELTLDEAELLEDANELLLDEEAEDLEVSQEETTLADD
ncbi:MAG: restriction endonuclease subunit S [Pyrinomonadaceae bacterium]